MDHADNKKVGMARLTDCPFTECNQVENWCVVGVTETPLPRVIGSLGTVKYSAWTMRAGKLVYNTAFTLILIHCSRHCER